MNTHFELVIVIPVYNEAKRISLGKYFNFLRDHENVLLCFVNDGSTDNTKDFLHNIELSAVNNVKVLTHEKNRGKAAAVLSGFLFCNTEINYDKIAYLDADLSTSLDACYSISQELNEVISFGFGSRIRKLDSFIKRKAFRFYVGRCIATIISKQLNLFVYDTQCGCKVFSRQLAQQVFQEKFVSTWLFDVEIFHRIQNLYGKRQLIRMSKEIPLRSWIDKDNSKVSPIYFFKMWLELIMIQKKYSVKQVNQQKVILDDATV